MARAPFHVRAATPTDARTLATIKISSWRAAYVGIVPDEVLAELDVDQLTTEWAQLLGDAPSQGWRAVFVTGPDGAVGGYACAGPYGLGGSDPDPDGPDGELYACYLDPEWWGSGAGVALIDAAESELRDLGRRVAGLWVFEQNARARRFYERHGWAPDGRVERRNPIGDAHPARVRYVKNLTS